MQILVLIGFVLAMASVSPGIVESLPRAGVLTPALAALYLLGAASLARAGVVMLLRSLAARSSPQDARRYQRVLSVERLWLIGGSVGLLFGGYADWISRVLGLQHVPLLAAWAAILPFATALALTWLVGYPAHRAIRRRMSHALPLGEEPLNIWTRRQYVVFQIRTHLLLIAVPLSLIVLLQDVLRLYVQPALGDVVGEEAILAAMALSAVCVLVGAPLLIRRVWSTQSLPDGPMRDDLTALCDQLGLRRRDILVWRSHAVLANAAVMGLVRPVRYVLLSDALLDRLQRRQVLAVCAHEAGHVVGHHMFYIALFALASALMAGAGTEAAVAATNWPAWIVDVGMLLMLAPTWIFGFGWLSRRLERQCDVAAAWAMSKLSADTPDDGPIDWDDPTITPRGAAITASALERIADLNGMSVRQPNWRHGSIAWRVHHVLSLAARGHTRRDIDRLVARIKRGLWLAFAVAVGANIAVAILLENTR